MSEGNLFYALNRLGLFVSGLFLVENQIIGKTGDMLRIVKRDPSTTGSSQAKHQFSENTSDLLGIADTEKPIVFMRELVNSVSQGINTDTSPKMRIGDFGIPIFEFVQNLPDKKVCGVFESMGDPIHRFSFYGTGYKSGILVVTDLFLMERYGQYEHSNHDDFLRKMASETTAHGGPAIHAVYRITDGNPDDLGSYAEELKVASTIINDILR